MHISSVRTAPSIAVLATFVALLATEALGAGGTPQPGLPVYHPETKSYYELRTDLPKPPNWGTAHKFAATKRFKGVRGQLAIVKDLETHSFLKANFTVYEEAWIGLRFYCGFRKLVWVNGDEHARSDFKVWARRWNRSNITCRTERSLIYMPVYYTPSENGFRWQASGQEKYFVSYFVQYPTGKP